MYPTLIAPKATRAASPSKRIRSSRPTAAIGMRTATSAIAKPIA
jgi:hypothetical protein